MRVLSESSRISRTLGYETRVGMRDRAPRLAVETQCDLTGSATRDSFPEPDPICPADWRNLATLHRECLPDSAVAELGERYAERFHRYIGGSSKEHMFLHRDSRGAIDAACVVSLDPRGLNRRLWVHTPLFARLLGNITPWRRRSLSSALSPFPRAHRFENVRGVSLPFDAPEIILIFVKVGQRRCGLGRALLDRSRAWLRAGGYRRCFARTLDGPHNRAADFYRATGFEYRGRSLRRGFQVWMSGV